jgi:type IV secretory pathway VirB2 component (pilin)
MPIRRRPLASLLPLLLLAGLGAAPAAWATGAGAMPWDAPIETIKGNISGPVLSAAAIIGLVLCGLTWGLTEHSNGVRKFVPLIFGISLAAGAVGLVSTFGWSGALL